MSTSKCIFHAYLINVLKMAQRLTIHSYKGKELQKSEEKRVLNIRKRLTDVTHDVITISWAHIIKGINCSR